MGKIAFTPFSVTSGFIAGLIARKLYMALWGMVDKEDPPQAEYRNISLGKLAVAVSLEGAVFYLVRNLTDHATRHLFEHLTGSWPGELEPQPE